MITHDDHVIIHLPKGHHYVRLSAHDEQLVVSSDDGLITFALSGRSLAEQLRSLADHLEGSDDWGDDWDPAPVSAMSGPPRRRQYPPRSTWDDLTPQAVIEYFEQSPVLRVHAADVRAVLEPLVDPAERVDDQLVQDVAVCARYRDELVAGGELVYGAQSRIADLLGITNGGGHRRRILAVARVLVGGEDEGEAVAA